jgi:cell wall assembly regulator SMI1
MSEIAKYLREMADEAFKLGIDLESNMNAAVSPEQIAIGTKELPFELPPEILELYLWKNGVRLDGKPQEIRMFPRFYFLPFQRCIETTQILISTVGKTHCQWQTSWYALCADLAGDYYAVNAAPGGGAFGRIFSVQEETEPFPAFWSFETMLLSIS